MYQCKLYAKLNPGYRLIGGSKDFGIHQHMPKIQAVKVVSLAMNHSVYMPCLTEGICILTWKGVQKETTSRPRRGAWVACYLNILSMSHKLINGIFSKKYQNPSLPKCWIGWRDFDIYVTYFDIMNLAYQNLI